MLAVFETKDLESLDMYQLCMLKQWLKLLTDDENQTFFPMALAVFHKCQTFRQFFFNFGESLCSRNVLLNLAKHDGRCPAIYYFFREYMSFFHVICSQIVNGCDVETLASVLSSSEIAELQKLSLSDYFNDSVLSNPIFITKFMSMRSLDLFGCGTMPDGGFDLPTAFFSLLTILFTQQFFIKKISLLSLEEMNRFLSIFFFVVHVELPPANIFYEAQTREDTCLRQPVLYHAFDRSCCEGPWDPDRNIFPFYDEHFIGSFSTLFYTVVASSNVVAENCRGKTSAWVLLLKKLEQFISCKQDLQVLSSIYFYLETLDLIIKSDGNLPDLIVSNHFTKRFLKILLNLYKPPIICGKLCTSTKTVIKKVSSVILGFLNLNDIVVSEEMAFVLFKTICNCDCCDSYRLRLLLCVVEKYPRIIINDVMILTSFCTTLLEKMNLLMKNGIDLKDVDELTGSMNLFHHFHLFAKKNTLAFTTIEPEKMKDLIPTLVDIINGNVNIIGNVDSDVLNLKAYTVFHVSAGILFVDLIHNTSYRLSDTNFVDNFRQLLASAERF